MGEVEPVLIRVLTGAALLGITPRQLYAWLARGLVPEDAVIHAGRAVYLRRDRLLAWATGNQNGEHRSEEDA
jgi:hypothetical protein